MNAIIQNFSNQTRRCQSHIGDFSINYVSVTDFGMDLALGCNMVVFICEFDKRLFNQRVSEKTFPGIWCAELTHLLSR
jgi:hypothetical protein